MSKILLIEGDLNNAFSGFRKQLVADLTLKHELIIVGWSPNQINFNLKYKDTSKIFYFGRLNRNPFYFLFYIIKIFIIIKNENPQICLSFNLRPNVILGIANYIFKIKSIATITGTSTFLSNPNKFKLKIFKFIFSKFEYTFFQNSEDKKLFEKYEIKSINYELVPGSGVDTEYFKDTNPKYNDSIINFILISRLIKEKGVIEYIEAAKILINDGYCARFLILGPYYNSGPKYNIIDEKVIKEAEHKNIIEYLGTSNDVKTFIINSDCVVLPSYREGMSNLLLEAASLSKPIITTNVPGCKEVVEHNFNGLLCNVKDTKDLANKMIQFIHLTKEQRRNMGINGRLKMLKEFDKKIVVSKYQYIIKKLI